MLVLREIFLLEGTILLHSLLISFKFDSDLSVSDESISFEKKRRIIKYKVKYIQGVPKLLLDILKADSWDHLEMIFPQRKCR